MELKRKPAYTQPSMLTVNRASGSNGMSSVSTFSGCGGSSLGMKLAGFKVRYANEFIPIAADVYALNHPNTFLSRKDIRETKAEEILDIIKLKRGQLDVLEGSPLCAAFSQACHGKHASMSTVRKYSETKQRVDDLFFEYVRLLDGLQPRAFIAENVRGLTHPKAIGYFKEIHASLTACGYKVKARMLDAQWLGVPQHRERLIFIGLRNDIDREIEFPVPLAHSYTVRDVLPEIIEVKGTGKGFGNTCLSADKPSLTITSSMQSPFNAYQITERSGAVRKQYTIDEVKRLCSFPSDFELLGTYAQQWERLGRSVPPLMMKAIAEKVREVLK